MPTDHGPQGAFIMAEITGISIHRKLPIAAIISRAILYFRLGVLHGWFLKAPKTVLRGMREDELPKICAN